MDAQLDIIDDIEFFYLNETIHTEKEIFIIVNSDENELFSVWQLKDSRRSDFGYSFKRICEVELTEIRENALRDALHELDIPSLKNMDESKNVCFAVGYGKEERTLANIIKDTILLNKGIAKGLAFEPTIIDELQGLLLIEKVMPFTLEQWIS
jgi:hypothetical protein